MRRPTSIAKREGWNEVSVWSAETRRKQTGFPDLRLLSAYRDYGVIPKDSRDDNYNRVGADLSAYQVVRPGNVVANKMKTWQGSIAVSELEGLVSPAYIVCDVDSSFDPRYLHYLLRSMPYVAEYRRLSYGVRPTQWDLRWDDLRDIRLLKPPANAQVAIADFLDLESALDDSHVYWTSEVDQFAEIFWKPAHLREATDQGNLNAVVDIAVGRFQDLEEEDQEDFRTVLAQFLRLYSFLAHIVVFEDPEIEKLHEYGRWLIRKLPRAEAVPNLDLDDDVALAAYRLDGMPPVDIDLEEGDTPEIPPQTGVGHVSEETYIRLSELIEAINERFGLNLTEADALFFGQVGQDMLTDDKLAAQAKAATKDHFKIAFEDAFIGAVLGRKDRNDDTLALILDKPDLAQALKNQMLDWIYHGLQERKSIPELPASGESDTVEFKSSARWNLHAGKETPEIKDAITKTVAAFLNTDGGTLLIGVNDDAEVVGLENDTQLVKGKDLDGFENWLMGAHLQSALGKAAAAHVKVSWGHLDGGDVCRLDVHSSPVPVYAKTSSAPKVFYVRLGNSTHEYDIEEAVEYIRQHWGM